MKKILITAFDPFGGEKTNPALEAVMALPDDIKGAKIIKQELPTVYGKSLDILYSKIESERPDAVICVGQAGGRPNISIERIAVNIDDTEMPDNEKAVHTDKPIVPEGPAAYFSGLPVKKIISNLHKAGIPASISNTAGTFVCNHVMYGVLHYADINKLNLPAGFIHIPYAPKQTIEKPSSPSMSADIVVNALKVIIGSVLE